MIFLVITVCALLLLGAVAAWWGRRDAEVVRNVPRECCGQHEVCERESLLAAVSKEVEYYDDEELDRFRGRCGAEYSEAESEEFRDTLYTMRDEDVAGWVRSLQLRGVALPDAVKDEVYLIIGERRSNA